LDLDEERVTLHVLHHEVRDAVGLAHVGDLDDVAMIDAIDRARLTEEALAIGGVQRERLVEDLDRGEALDDDVLRQVHGRHAARAEALDQPIARRDRATEELVRHFLERHAVLRTERGRVLVELAALGTNLQALRLAADPTRGAYHPLRWEAAEQ